MTRILLIAPGKTDWDQQDRIQGDVELPLAEAGRRTMERRREEIGEEGRELAILYSGLNRHVLESARILTGANGLAVKTREELGEPGLGLWQGLLRSELKTKHRRTYKSWRENPASVQPPAGEAFDAVVGRIEKFVEFVKRKHGGQTVAVVCGRTVVGVLLCLLRGEPFERLWELCEEFPGKDLIPIGENNGSPAPNP